MLDITADECKRRVNEFLDAHIENYTEREIKYIRNNAALLAKHEKNNYGSSILRQIFDSVGLIPDNENIYYGFIELIENNFDINKNIVEAAGGIIPSLATKIALRQKTGTITVYDPRIITQLETPSNLILKRQTFTKYTPIQPNSLIIGFMPCDATIPIIESAVLNNIDFMIALCEGGARTGYEWLENDDEWIEYMKYIARRGLERQPDKKLGILSLEQYGDPYPIIYSKKK